MGRLALHGLCKGWDFPVIDRLDLAVEPGELFVIIGPSGIGKTTLLRLIAGLETPDAGRVVIDGREVTHLPPYRRRVAMTFESYALYPHLTVFENIASPLRARRLDRATVQRKVLDMARLLRIDPLLDRRPGEISGGQKQRTALGRTLVAEPLVFLLDEPISHLDAKIRHELRRELHQLQALRSVATLYVTHDYAEALALGDRIGVMGEGGLVQIGSAREVYLQPRSLFVAQHLGQPSINLLACELRLEGGRAFAAATGTRFAVPLPDRHRAVIERTGVRAAKLGIRPGNLRALADGEPANGAVPLDGRVELFEPLGSTGVLVVDSGGALLTVLTSPDREFRHGAPIRLALDAQAVLLFDIATERNLLL